MNLGETLYNLRKDKNLSQEEVADKLNVTRQTVSKWETGESKPDFDKIVPICNLFSITAEELLNGKMQDESEEIVEVKEEKQVSISTVKYKRAALLSIGIFLYFVGIGCIIFCSESGISDTVGVTLFFVISGIATGLIVYQGVVYSKGEEEDKIRKVKNKKLKLATDILSTIFAFIYFLISLATMRWDITWIIWIIYAVCESIMKLGFELRGEKDGK